MNKTIIALVALCVVLGLSFFLVQGDRPAVDTGAHKTGKLLKDLNTDTIKDIEIKKGDVDIKLEKKDKDWTLPKQKNRLAKSDRVEELLTALKGAQIDDLRPGKLEAFALDEKNRVEVQLNPGGTTAYVGKNLNYNSSFVRTRDSGDTYEVDKDLATKSGIRGEKEQRVLDPSYFYDLKVVSLNTEDIIDIVIKKGNDTVRLQKMIPGKGPLQPKQELAKDSPKPVWWITEPEKEKAAADENKVSRITSSLSPLNAKSYADEVPEKDRGFDKPAATIHIVSKDGTENTITFGKVDGEDVLLALTGKEDPYKVYKYVFDSLTQTASELKKKEEEKKETAAPPPPVPPAHVVQEPKVNIAPSPPVAPPPPAIKPTKTELPAAVVKPGEAPKLEEKK